MELLFYCSFIDIFIFKHLFQVALATADQNSPIVPPLFLINTPTCVGYVSYQRLKELAITEHILFSG